MPAPIDIQFRPGDSEAVRLQKLNRLSQGLVELSRALSQLNADTNGGDTTEATTALNVGTGTGVFRDKTGTQLNLRSLLAGAGIAVSLVGDDIVITAIPADAPIDPLVITQAF